MCVFHFPTTCPPSLLTPFNAVLSPLPPRPFIARSVTVRTGDGTGEHPTQALLDIFTIKTELGTIGSEDPDDPVVVTLLGDLKNGRTVHSLVRLLAKFPNVHLNYIAPPILAMPLDIIDELTALGVPQNSSLTLEEAIGSTDVLYVTRIQKERWVDFENMEVHFPSSIVLVAFIHPALASVPSHLPTNSQMKTHAHSLSHTLPPAPSHTLTLQV